MKDRPSTIQHRRLIWYGRLKIDSDYQKEGLEDRYQRHRKDAAAMQAALETLGFKYWQ